MAVQINVEYEGNLHCSAVHGPSASVLSTDAPADNHGLAQTFSPTDLVATAIGSCMLTVMGIYAGPRNLDLKGARAIVEKEMTKTPPRRIAKLTVRLQLPCSLRDRDRAALEQVAQTCPVAASLHPEVDVELRFEYVV